MILAITLGATGANQLAANPWVNLFIGSLFVYFALSLFGAYEIQLPKGLRQLSLEQEKRGGYVGTLFMAVTFTLTSFTCTCLLYTSPSPRDATLSRMPSSA